MAATVHPRDQGRQHKQLYKLVQACTGPTPDTLMWCRDTKGAGDRETRLMTAICILDDPRLLAELCAFRGPFQAEYSVLQGGPIKQALNMIPGWVGGWEGGGGLIRKIWTFHNVSLAKAKFLPANDSVFA
ncbi:hypothetical protein FRC08_013190 [Ceratobasidium sp. 394]|nr:hypothetical protein FRC08_013190 [Ceratobasidium sp. 394]